MPHLRRTQFSPLSSFRTALRIGVMATAATFSGDTDLDAAEHKSVPGLGLNLVQVNPGSFTFGSAPAANGEVGDEGPQTRVTLSKAFWLGATEITVGQWRQFADAAKYQTEAETGGGMSAWIGGPARFEIRQDLSWKN